MISFILQYDQNKHYQQHKNGEVDKILNKGGKKLVKIDGTYNKSSQKWLKKIKIGENSIAVGKNWWNV